MRGANRAHRHASRPSSDDSRSPAGSACSCQPPRPTLLYVNALQSQPASAPTDWSSAGLWTLLQATKDAGAASARRYLETWLPQAQVVLAHADSGDRTLHDSGHSFRVAQLMLELVPSDLRSLLSSYEVGHLLLAAYLHDIGMAPTGPYKRGLLELLCKGTRTGLDNEEVELLLDWFGDASSDLGLSQPEPRVGSLSVDDAEMVFFHWLAHRHAELGRRWIRDHLHDDAVPPAPYTGFVDDLTDLCQSHHWGFEQLVGQAFDPGAAGTAALPIHRRFLACLLRVADVLDVSPDRTPPILARHRAIHSTSVIYWNRDHNLTIRIADGDGGTTQSRSVVLHARPLQAVVQSAILDLAQQVDRELEVVHRLHWARPFDRGATGSVLPHRWDIALAAKIDVEPRPDTYVYIPGTFRPSSTRLLGLFAGLELYREPLAAVRELLQNAFDAVREQQAYTRLALNDPASPEHDDLLAAGHHVSLSLKSGDDGNYYLECTDSGIGLTKDLISSQFLVSGSPPPPATRRLARRCEAAGFHLERSGRFGLGVLSYFMIADAVHVSTCRSQDAGGDSSGWTFDTDGFSGFGELRAAPLGPSGTQLRLRMRRDAVGDDPDAWFGRLVKYLRAKLVRVPCELRIASVTRSGEEVLLGPGWTTTRSDWQDVLAAQLAVDHVGRFDWLPIRSRDQEEFSRALESVRQRSLQDYTERGRFVQVEGSLVATHTRFRVITPLLGLPGGPTPLYLRAVQSNGPVSLLGMGGGFWLTPSVPLRVGHGGFVTRVGDLDKLLGFGIIEIDLPPSLGRPAIARDLVDTPPGVTDSCGWIASLSWDVAAQSLAGEHRGPYALLSAAVLHRPDVAGRESSWPMLPPDRRAGGGYPVGNMADGAVVPGDGTMRLGSFARTVAAYRADGSSLPLAPYVPRGRLGPPEVVAVNPLEGGLRVERVVRLEQGKRWTVGCAVDSRRVGGDRLADQVRDAFPASWSQVAGIVLGYAAVWNRGHPLMSVASDPDLEWAINWWHANHPPVDEVLRTPGRCAACAMVLMGLGLGRERRWKLREVLEDGALPRDFIRRLYDRAWSTMGTTRTQPGSYVWYGGSRGGGRGSIVFEQGHIQWVGDAGRRGRALRRLEDRWMPNPGKDWTMQIRTVPGAPRRR